MAGHPDSGDAIDVAAWRDLAAQVRTLTEEALLTWFRRRSMEVQRLGQEASTVLQAVVDLTMRPAKRLRPAFAAAAYVACGGARDLEAVVPAFVSLELFQGYLLIHDDLIDGDDIRRGGPSVHVMLRDLFPAANEALSGSGGILAGDFANAEAMRAMAAVRVSPERLAKAFDVFAEMQSSVVLGQVLDMSVRARTLAEVEGVHAQKTASYTTRGPLALGAVLAGASSEVLATLDAYAAPLGVAFQLADDWLGVFGDPQLTGKTRGADLRAGKHTALVVELLATGDATDRALLEEARRSDDAVPRAIVRLEASGARRRVEERSAALFGMARRALAADCLDPSAQSLLRGAARALEDRRR